MRKLVYEKDYTIKGNKKSENFNKRKRLRKVKVLKKFLKEIMDFQQGNQTSKTVATDVDVDKVMKDKKIRELLEELVNADSDMAVEFLHAIGYFKACDKFERYIPKIINEKDRENYGRLLKDSYSYAKNHYGKVKGVIDYERYQATIKIIVPIFEFETKEDREFLKDVTENAALFWFERLENGKIVFNIFLKYFDNVEISEEEKNKYMERAVVEAVEEIRAESLFNSEVKEQGEAETP